MESGGLQVYILTRVVDMDTYYGSELIFKSLRVGFPNATINVVENASIKEARPKLRAASRMAAVNEFVQLDEKVALHEFITERLRRQDTGAAVFLHPDTMFWRSVEDWYFPGATLLAGRLLPTYVDEITNTITRAHLHSSFLWIPDVAQFRDTVGQIFARHFEWHPVRPLMWRESNGGWHRIDTAGSVYSALPGQMYPFTDPHLDCYDHLMHGSRLEYVLPRIRGADKTWLENVHAKVKDDYTDLKGLWREQQRYYDSRVIALPK